jgi:predicted MFS family arabinose efflux permease
VSTHLALIGAAGFISMAAFRVTDPLPPAIADEFHVSIGRVAMTVTAFTVGYDVLQLVYGPLGDRIGKVRVMSGALALTGLLTTACALTPDVLTLTALRFAGGMAAGAMVPLSIAHIGDTVLYGSRQATIARFLAATTMGQVIGGSLAGLFAEYFGWRLSFVVLGAAGLAIAIPMARLSARLPRPVHAQSAAARVTHWCLLEQRNTRIVWGAVFVEGLLVLGAIPYAGAYLKHVYSLDYLTIGLVLGCFGLGGASYSFVVRWLIAHLGERRMVIAGGATVCASYGLMTLASSWLLFAPALALIGIGFFTMHSTLQTRATELAPEARGTALSGFSFCLFLGQGVGVYLISHIVDGPGCDYAFALASIGVAVLAAWLYRALRQSREP